MKVALFRGLWQSRAKYPPDCFIPLKNRQKKTSPGEIAAQARDEQERNYLLGLEREHRSIQLFGFQSSANIPVRTLEVFVSLRLSYVSGGDLREREHEFTPTSAT